VYHELTDWSRGIIMDKEARDVASCIATAARNLGYYADHVSGYVDDPDRANCLVRRYARFGDTPIAGRFVCENPNPDWVVLAEESIIKAVDFLRGTPEGAGVLVVNSAGAVAGRDAMLRGAAHHRVTDFAGAAAGTPAGEPATTR
jgi:hypothetical protein